MNECTSKYLDDQFLSADLSSDLALAAQWEKDWLISFNTPKTKLIMYHHQVNPKSVPILINGQTLKEVHRFYCLLGQKLTPDLKRNVYIDAIIKDTGRTIGSFYHSRKYLTPAAITKRKLEYCWSCPILSCLERVQKFLCSFVSHELFSTLQPLSHRRNVASFL